jgi:hypothetical protein
MMTHESSMHPAIPVELRDRAEHWVLAFLAFANVFDLGGGFGLKYLSYALCAVFLLICRDDLRMSRSAFLVCALLFVLWPLFAAIQGVVRGGDLGRAVQRITAFAPALLVMPVIASSTNPRRLLDAVMASLLALAVVIIGLFFLLLLLPNSAASDLILIALGGGEHGYFGARLVGSLVIPTVYFKATLFLVPACIWFLYSRRYLASALCFIALVLAFSRSGALIAAVVVFAHGFILAPLRVRVGLACLVLAVGYVLWSNSELLQVGAILDMYLDVLSGRGRSSIERAGHFRSIVELLAQDPQLLWLGQGAGVSFFSSGVNAFVAAVELDHLDAIRSFGLLWFIGFVSVVLRAAGVGMRLESQEARGLRIAVLAAFVAAGTNPVLISPLFFILAVASYYFLAPDAASRRV